MEKRISLKHWFFPSWFKSIISLVKPGIIMGNLIPMIAGFFLGSKMWIFEYETFFSSIIGVSLIIASGCALNNVIDKDIDALMQRTKNRPLPRGEISPFFALIFSFVLGAFGLYILFSLNFTVGILGITGLFVYVVLYSLVFKRRSPYAIHIGSVSGAIPPLIGYTAASGHINLGGILLFLMLVFWQMPHSFAISIFNSKDYTVAKIPTTYKQRGIKYTKNSCLFYIAAFTAASSLLTFYSYTTALHLINTAFIGGYWLSVTARKIKQGEEDKWARKVFFTSIIVIMLISISITLS